MSTRPVTALAAGLVVVAAAVWTAAAPGPAVLAPDPVAAGVGGASTYGAPRVVCTVRDRRLPEISGAATIGGALAVANDHGVRYVRLDPDCGVEGGRGWTGPRTGGTPLVDRDVEDLAVGPDGTVWFVDAGGNRRARTTVSLLGLTPAGESVEITFAYPLGTHDAEAAVVTSDLRLVVFTKARGTSTVYAARIPAVDPTRDVTGPVGLEEVGRLDLDLLADPATDADSRLVTGAALSPDGQHVALRTYDEIFEWALDGPDLATEMVEEQPARVAVVGQRQGEALTYTADGARLLALSEQLPSPVLGIDVTRTAAPRPPGTGEGVPTWGYRLLGGAGGLLLLVLVAGLRRRRPPGPVPSEETPTSRHDAGERPRVPVASGAEGAR